MKVQQIKLWKKNSIPELQFKHRSRVSLKPKEMSSSKFLFCSLQSDDKGLEWTKED